MFVSVRGTNPYRALHIGMPIIPMTYTTDNTNMFVCNRHGVTA